jgi:hypothetical protein
MVTTCLRAKYVPPDNTSIVTNITPTANLRQQQQQQKEQKGMSQEIQPSRSLGVDNVI